jgi:hypothetical protein
MVQERRNLWSREDHAVMSSRRERAASGASASIQLVGGIATDLLGQGTARSTTAVYYVRDVFMRRTTKDTTSVSLSHNSRAGAVIAATKRHGDDQ